MCIVDSTGSRTKTAGSLYIKMCQIETLHPSRPRRSRRLRFLFAFLTAQRAPRPVRSPPRHATRGGPGRGDRRIGLTIRQPNHFARRHVRRRRPCPLRTRDSRAPLRTRDATHGNISTGPNVASLGPGDTGGHTCGRSPSPTSTTSIYVKPMLLPHGGWPMAAGPVSRLGSFEPGDRTGVRL